MLENHTMSSNGLQWYALQVHSRLSSLAASSLEGKGYEQFLPLYLSRRRWSDRVKQIAMPLFPGYLFCRFDPSNRLVPVLTTPGVKNIVGVGRRPIAIPAAEIDAVRAVVRSGLDPRPWPFLSVGSRVHLDSGPLSGVEGVITCTDKVDRLIVSINLLQRSVAVEIDRRWVRPVGDPLVFSPIPQLPGVASGAL